MSVLRQLGKNLEKDEVKSISHTRTNAEQIKDLNVK